MQNQSPESSQRLQTKNIQLNEQKLDNHKQIKTQKQEQKKQKNPEIISKKDVISDPDIIKNRPAPPIAHKDKVKKKKHLLSFGDEIEQVGEIIQKNTIIPKQSIISVQHNLTLQERLKEQYIRQSERMKEELFEFEYSYWDGPNTIKKLRRKKKQRIGQLLQVCRLQFIQNFQHLAKVSSSELLFVIKDFMVPHEMAVFQIQALELKTSTNDPLFSFKNVQVKKDGKEVTLSVNFGGPIRIIQKTKYQKNKVLYPFCNWHTLNLK